jgi:hypothetical protein
VEFVRVPLLDLVDIPRVGAERVVRRLGRSAPSRQPSGLDGGIAPTARFRSFPRGNSHSDRFLVLKAGSLGT